jgi:hypothetical protein
MDGISRGWTEYEYWTSPTLDYGSHTFSVVAEDAEGAMSETDTWSFVVEAGSYVPKLTSPTIKQELDNGRTDFNDLMVWDFDWEDVSGAEKYHLYVWHFGASSPLIDSDVITASSYHKETRSYILNGNRFNWAWKVRAYVDGKWGDWSAPWFFDVEPVNTDPPE